MDVRCGWKADIVLAGLGCRTGWGESLLRALFEVLGALLANAPLSDDGKGRRQRIFALMMVVGALVLGVCYRLQT